MDRQTERVNAGIKQYLCQFTNFLQDDWADWLPLAEFAANNVTSESTGVSPFFTNYGFNPKLGIEPSQPAPPCLTKLQKRQFNKANMIADRFDRILSQLTAIAKQSTQRYEDNANLHRSDALRYTIGQEVYVDTRNMKTNCPLKKGDDKWAGPFRILSTYLRACLLGLPEGMKIFPIFHHSLLRPKTSSKGLPGQDLVNKAESKNIRGRVLERKDGTDDLIEKWEFEKLLDCHNKQGLHYLVKWKHHAPSWQPASDLKGQDKVIFDFHNKHPDKPGPPPWARHPPVL
jgi:hypothetical protein